MREYETVVITKADLPESHQKQINDRARSIIEKHEGRLFYARSMGKRTLAYPISKQTKGLYTCLDYVARGSSIGELERSMRLDENVLRFLTVVKNEEVDVEARAAEIVARGEDIAVPSYEAEAAPVPAAGAEAGKGEQGGAAAAKAADTTEEE